ncbi:MAG: GNAT family N-acetyltransferase [Acidimicrobiales bacterium]
MTAPAFEVRRGQLGDLLACTAIWRSTSGEPSPAPTAPYFLYRHELETGTLVVAESDHGLIGFGASLPRSGRWFLADLFIDPATQSTGVGRRLLDALLAIDQPGPARATLASGDPRAVSLYTRLGMTPRFPVFYLTARSAGRFPGPPQGWAVTEVAGDRFSPLAAELGLRIDRLDVAYLAANLDVTWVDVVDRGGRTVASAAVRWGHPFVASDPRAVTVAPLVLAPDAAPSDVAGVLLAWIEGQGRRPDGSGLRLFVPGPHPLLPVLLDAGFAIVDVDTLCASDAALAGPAALDPTRTCPATDMP